jgi:hypothetical protein
MNQPTFIQARQQLSALALSATLTVAMLISMNALATRPAADAQMASATPATPAAQTAVHAAAPRA